MRILGRDFYWSEGSRLEERGELAQVTVNDLGIAFVQKMQELTGTTSEAIPAVFRAMQFISDTVAGLHMEEIERGTVNTPTPRILEQPNPAETYQDTLNQITNSLLFTGNAYLLPRTFDDLGFPTSIIVANPSDVQCRWDANKIYPVYEWRERPMTAGTEIIPIPLNRWPGRPDGVSPVSACRLMLEGAHAEQSLATHLMTDDATPPLAISVPEKITQPEAAAIRDTWEATHGGGNKRPGVLGGGATLERMAFSPVDAQFLESRTFTVQEIARMFGLHGLFLLVPSGDSLTYSTTESLFRLTLTMTIAPTYLERIEQAFSRMLPAGRKARFNTDQLLRADLQARYTSYETALRAGFLTADEVRGLEGMGPLPAGAVANPVTNGRVTANV